MKIVVVGAGIAGLSTAWQLVKRGHTVYLVEQAREIPNPLSASGDQHRIIRRAYGGADGYARNIDDAYAAWNEMWNDLGCKLVEDTGFLCVSQWPDDEADIYRQGLERGSYHCELFEPAEAARRWPFLEEGTFRYAAFSREGGVLFCQIIARLLGKWISEHRGIVLKGARIKTIDTAAGKVRIAGGPEIEADRVVVTAGAWVNELFPALAGTLVTYRTAVAYFEPPEDLAEVWMDAPVVLDIGGDADGYILPPVAGCGLKFGTGHHRRPTGNPNAGRVPYEGEAEEIRARFSPPLARLDEYRPGEVVTCCYTFTEDEKFFAAREGRTLVVSACSGHGYKFGAAVGRRVADAVESDDDGSLIRWLRAEQAG
ncbi:MAG: NAD(P)/FAD-dependent oxidoreductase [Flavobacteriaceae bacterium]